MGRPRRKSWLNAFGGAPHLPMPPQPSSSRSQSEQHYSGAHIDSLSSSPPPMPTPSPSGNYSYIISASAEGSEEHEYVARITSASSGEESETTSRVNAAMREREIERATPSPHVKRTSSTSDSDDGDEDVAPATSGASNREVEEEEVLSDTPVRNEKLRRRASHPRQETKADKKVEVTVGNETTEERSESSPSSSTTSSDQVSASENPVIMVTPPARITVTPANPTERSSTTLSSSKRLSYQHSVKSSLLIPSSFENQDDCARYLSEANIGGGGGSDRNDSLKSMDSEPSIRRQNSSSALRTMLQGKTISATSSSVRERRGSYNPDRGRGLFSDNPTRPDDLTTSGGGPSGDESSPPPVSGGMLQSSLARVFFEETEATAQQEGTRDHFYKKSVKSKSSQRSKYYTVLHPKSTGVRIWHLTISLVVLYFLFMIPYQVAFDVRSATIFPPKRHMLVDILLIIDIWVQLHTAYVAYGEVVYLPEKIVATYKKSRHYVMDFVSVFPFEYICAMIYSTTAMYGFTNQLLSIPLLKWVALYPLVSLKLVASIRLLKFHRLSEGAYVVEKMIGRRAGRLSSLAFMVILITHWIACCYWIIGRVQGFGTTPFVPSRSMIEENDGLSQYLHSFYVALTLASGIGEAKFPVTNLEIAFALVVSLVGITIYATIIGNVGSLLSQKDPNVVLYEDKIESVRTFMKYHKLPNELTKRVVNHYKLMWARQKGIQGLDVLHDLPVSIRTEVSLHLSADILSQVPVFQAFGDTFIAAISPILRPQVFAPGDVIYHEGEVGDEMYFLAKGISQSIQFLIYIHL